MLKAERFYRARTYRKYLLILYYKYVYFDVLHSLHVVCSLAGLIVYLTHFHFWPTVRSGHCYRKSVRL